MLLLLGGCDELRACGGEQGSASICRAVRLMPPSFAGEQPHNRQCSSRTRAPPRKRTRARLAQAAPGLQKLAVRPTLRNPPARVQNDHAVGKRQHPHLVRGEHAECAGEGAAGADGEADELLRRGGVDGSERVVEESDVRIRVHGSCKRHALLLPCGGRTRGRGRARQREELLVQTATEARR